ncbi:hypothetical protein [Microbulbifer sp. ZKSA002]|uniref:hypothetical protein n=1 Tax=Microbulbifer sp. ZKSA002 TaxID=3243388 RepID=UPI004039F342
MPDDKDPVEQGEIADEKKQAEASAQAQGDVSDEAADKKKSRPRKKSSETKDSSKQTKGSSKASPVKAAVVYIPCNESGEKLLDRVCVQAPSTGKLPTGFSWKAFRLMEVIPVR